MSTLIRTTASVKLTKVELTAAAVMLDRARPLNGAIFFDKAEHTMLPIVT